METNRIKIGISSCLLGNNVRYNGGHTRDAYVVNTLGAYLDFTPVCPEVECGLSTPREAMRLVGTPEAPRLLTIKTKIDYTDQMLTWAKTRLDLLEKENLCGFIFMSKSPSSGMERVKIYNEKGVPTKSGRGLFAAEFIKRFPLIPVEEDGRLHDPGLRESFIERLFAMQRLRALQEEKQSAGALIEFHTDHKLQMMAHSPKIYQEMGRLVAGATKKTLQSAYKEYERMFLEGLKLKATVKKHYNVMQHILGYFKTHLSPDEKQEALEIMNNYRDGLVPLIVPITLLNHFVRKYDESYLKRQHYLHPHPLELKLRNHV